MQGNRRKTRSLEFRNTGQTEAALKTKIQDLFDGAKKKWEGVFSEEITLPKESTRQQITQKVGESRKVRDQSKQLLEIAKTGVERAIETDQATATAWINQQLEVLGINLTTTT